MSRTGRPRSNIWPLVIEDYKGGMSVSSIAEKHNLSVWGIKKALKREGIFIPKPVGLYK